jgi:hypothetical protein
MCLGGRSHHQGCSQKGRDDEGLAFHGKPPFIELRFKFMEAWLNES